MPSSGHIASSIPGAMLPTHTLKVGGPVETSPGRHKPTQNRHKPAPHKSRFCVGFVSDMWGTLGPPWAPKGAPRAAQGAPRRGHVCGGKFIIEYTTYRCACALSVDIHEQC